MGDPRVSLHPMWKLLWDPQYRLCHGMGTREDGSDARPGPGLQSNLVTGVRHPEHTTGASATLLTLASDGQTPF